MVDFWWLYLVECADGRLYAGIARDPHNRFEKHRSGRGAAFTRINGAKALLACQPFEDHRRSSKIIEDHRSAAQAEYRLKRLTRTAKLEWAYVWSQTAIFSNSDASESNA